MSETPAQKALADSHPYRWVIMGMGFMAVFAALGLGRFGYSAILPEMQTQLGLTSQQAGSLASWNLAGYLALTVAGGLLATRLGARSVVTFGLVVTALGMLLAGRSSGVPSASVACLLTGLGGGVVLVPSVALMSSWFDQQQRGLASAIVNSGSALALVMVGPVVPRLMAAGGNEGWRLAWYLFAGVTFLLAIANAVIIRNRPVAPVEPSGSPGRRPLEWKRVIRSGFAWHLGSIAMIFAFAYTNYLLFFQKRLIDDIGLAAETAGTLYLVLGLCSLLCGVIWGPLSDRIGRSQAMAVMLTLQAASSALFAFWPTTAGTVISAAFFGLTAVSLPGVFAAACGDRFGSLLAPASFGFVTLLGGVGQVVGPVAAGRMTDAFSSLTPTYALSAGLFIVAATAAIFLPCSREDHRVDTDAIVVAGAMSAGPSGRSTQHPGPGRR